MGREETKKVAVIKVDDNNGKDKKRLITIISLSLLIVTDLVLTGIFLIPRIINKSKQTNNSYSVSEESVAIYNNIVSYVNKETKGTNIDNANSIISLSYYDKALNIVLDCGEYPCYFKIDMPTTHSVDSALNVFKDSVPLGMAEIMVKEQYDESKNITVDDKSVTAVITKDISLSYVSFIDRYDDNTLFAIAHEEYNQEGVYTHIHKVTPESDHLLFDVYYYCLNNCN